MENWFTENAIYLLAVIAVIFSIAWLGSFRGMLKISSAAVFFVSVVFAALVYLSVKIFAVIEYLDFSAFSKMSLFGAIFFMPFAVWAAAKLLGVNTAVFFDICTPAFIFMFMCGRINCLITGCCYGINLTENYRWPVREGEITLYLVLLIIFCIRMKKGRFTGRCWPVFLISYGIFRFSAEFVRWFPDQDGLWHRGHIFAAAAAAAGTVWLAASAFSKRRRALSKHSAGL